MYKFEIKPNQDYVVKVNKNNKMLKANHWNLIFSSERKKDFEINCALILDQLSTYYNGTGDYRITDVEGNLTKIGKIN